ncbi:MAG: hypothetical protein M3162_05595 [Thermoproteota archaeon]|nr:hypothetical protein [Thermoproteota archaeon]
MRRRKYCAPALYRINQAYKVMRQNIINIKVIASVFLVTLLAFAGTSSVGAQQNSTSTPQQNTTDLDLAGQNMTGQNTNSTAATANEEISGNNGGSNGGEGNEGGIGGGTDPGIGDGITPS